MQMCPSATLFHPHVLESILETNCIHNEIHFPQRLSKGEYCLPLKTRPRILTYRGGKGKNLILGREKGGREGKE